MYFYFSNFYWIGFRMKRNRIFTIWKCRALSLPINSESLLATLQNPAITNYSFTSLSRAHTRTHSLYLSLLIQLLYRSLPYTHTLQYLHTVFVCTSVVWVFSFLCLSFLYTSSVTKQREEIILSFRLFYLPLSVVQTSKREFIGIQI